MELFISIQLGSTIVDIDYGTIFTFDAATFKLGAVIKNMMVLNFIVDDDIKIEETLKSYFMRVLDQLHLYVFDRYPIHDVIIVCRKEGNRHIIDLSEFCRTYTTSCISKLKHNAT